MLNAVLLCVTVLLSLASIGNSVPVKRNVLGPVVTKFPDPTIIKVNNVWYAFATNTDDYGGTHVQIAKSSDFSSWTKLSKDALPNLPSWVDSAKPAVWAPDVIQNDSGEFVMYFSAALASNSNFHCFGVATSSNIEGPYTARDSTFECPLASGGAIDAAGFRDDDGTRWVTYKIDGNSIGHGGVCNNGVEPIVGTPIMLQQVAGNGIDKIGSATKILGLDPIDGPSIEAPSISRIPDGRYVLFFSSNCFSTTNYDVTYALADSVTGPYTKHGPLFVTGNYGLTAPGGASIHNDGKHLVFHAKTGDVRSMYTATISFNGNVASA